VVVLARVISMKMITSEYGRLASPVPTSLRKAYVV
jgi:hypothetical protein